MASPTARLSDGSRRSVNSSLPAQSRSIGTATPTAGSRSVSASRAIAPAFEDEVGIEHQDECARPCIASGEVDSPGVAEVGTRLDALNLRAVL